MTEILSSVEWRVILVSIHPFPLPSNSSDTSFLTTLSQIWQKHYDAETGLFSAPVLSDSVAAVARWDLTGEEQEPCSVASVQIGMLGLEPNITDVAEVVCPLQQSSTQLPFWDFPNYFISVNFTDIYGPVFPGSHPSFAPHSVRVYVGTVGNLETVIKTTEPISLFPGSHIMSVIHPVVRQRLKPATLGTLGFEACQSPLVSRIAMLTSFTHIVAGELHDSHRGTNTA
jgi:hypothetical protein